MFATWSIEAACDGHLRQLALARDPARHIIAMCSRRAGKSTAVCSWLAAGALERPGTDSMYIAITRGQAGWTVWERIWKPLCKRWGFPCKHDESEQVTTFENGSRVVFAGTDDVAHIETFLCAKLWRVAVDECQSQSDTVLEPLLTRILPPALSDEGGQLLVAGTIPEVAAGVFWTIWESGGAAWSRHTWSRFDNPHLHEQRKRLDEHLAAHPGLTEDDPTIRRDWFGDPVFDPAATAYRYLPRLNGYVPEPPAWFEDLRAELGQPLTLAPGIVVPPVPIASLMAAVPWQGIDTFAVGIDLGGGDRCALEVMGWGPGRPEVQHVFEWSSPRGARATWAQIARVASAVARHFPGAIRWYFDTTSKNDLDTFRLDFGVPVLKAANKTDRSGQIERNNTLLTTGRLKVMLGSALVEDYQKARLDKKTKQWTSAWHPDPSEAGRYALGAYHELYAPPPPPRTRSQADVDAEAERVRELYKPPAPTPAAWNTDLARQLGVGRRPS